MLDFAVLFFFQYTIPPVRRATVNRPAFAFFRHSLTK